MLGLILGSFIATLVIRWPAGRSLGGRSGCDGCGRVLGAAELVPLASALVLRGRCRACGARIDPRHWWTELAAAAIGALSGRLAPGFEGVAGAVFGWLLLTLALLDLAAWWLPDRLTGLLAVTGLAGGAAGIGPPLVDRLIGGTAGFALLLLVSLGYRRVRGRAGMGGGDPKLFGAIGLWLGWAMLPPVLLVASLLGLGVMLVAALTGRRMAGDAPLPLGALLAAAAYPAWALMIGLSP
ncbi:prepilin peptidase [Sphingomonas sp.]|uniref:prepilin peptidase n=1 Tax=Sphingomonas sp. TaxID=28214 RepID=UPI003CC5B140